jgi:hypothetical protein
MALHIFWVSPYSLCCDLHVPRLARRLLHSSKWVPTRGLGNEGTKEKSVVACTLKLSSPLLTPAWLKNNCFLSAWSNSWSVHPTTCLHNYFLRKILFRLFGSNVFSNSRFSPLMQHFLRNFWRICNVSPLLFPYLQGTDDLGTYSTVHYMY